MKSSIFMAALILMSVGTTRSFAEAAVGESHQTKYILEKDVDRLTADPKEASQALTKDLNDRYGLQVSCSSGFWKFWHGLNSDECYIGLVNLQEAIAKKGVKKEDIPEGLKVELASHGGWQGLTFNNRKVCIPFDASSNAMEKFLGDQIEVAYNTSLAKLLKVNGATAEDLHDRYNISVRAKHLDPYQTHDGLEKLRVALQMLTTANHGKMSVRDMGFDAIVLARHDSQLVDEGQELVAHIDAMDSAGQMYMTLNHAISAPRKFNVGLENGMTWNEVTNFQESRELVGQLQSWFHENLPEKRVECLVSADSWSDYLYEISVPECRQGLETLQRAVGRLPEFRTSQKVDRIVIASAMVASSWVDSDEKTLYIDYGADVDKVVAALGEQK